MNFKQVYELVDCKLGLSIEDMLKECNTDLVYDNDLSHGHEAWSMIINDTFMICLQEGLNEIREQFLILHELGHYYCDSRLSTANKRNEESSVNLFVCLYLLKNQIWHDCYFQEFFSCNGCERRTANIINEKIYQFKLSRRSELGWKILEYM